MSEMAWCSSSGSGLSAHSPVAQNVVMKLGGCGMPAYGWGYEERDAPPSSDEMATAWQPYFAELIEAFGVERCMFESNFPIDKVSCSYTNLWKRVQESHDGAKAHGDREERALP